MLRFLFRSRKKTDCWTAFSPDGNSCPPASCGTRLRTSRRPGASPSATSCCPAARRRRSARERRRSPAPVPARWRSIVTGSVTPEPVLPPSGVLVFAVLTAYHTIGGGALAEPYGDLVIFFVPPMFVIAGVVIVLIGMYVQWIRWRMHKPLSFARYPKWDLNLAAERKALLAVAIGAAILSIPAIYGEQPGVSLHRRRVILRRVLPLHDPGVRHLSAVAACARGLRAVPCRTGRCGYVESKMRGMVELVETIQNDYPRPIPVPVEALRPIRGNCEQCHWPANFFGRARCTRVHFLVRRAEYALGNRHAGAGRRRRTPADTSRMGIHWHVAGKVEYVASRRRTAEHHLGAGGRSDDRRGEGVHLPAAELHRDARR